jgi:hypothetical protein
MSIHLNEKRKDNLTQGFIVTTAYRRVLITKMSRELYKKKLLKLIAVRSS